MDPDLHRAAMSDTLPVLLAVVALLALAGALATVVQWFGLGTLLALLALGIVAVYLIAYRQARERASVRRDWSVIGNTTGRPS